jgi:protein TonB
MTVFLTPLVYGQSPESSPPANTDSHEKPSKVFRAGRDGIAPASCTYMPNPPYTKEARKAKFSGVVVVDATIMPDGKLEQLIILKSPGLGLDESVVRTLKKWKCNPVIGPDGTAVPALVALQVNFRLY